MQKTTMLAVLAMLGWGCGGGSHSHDAHHAGDHDGDDHGDHGDGHGHRGHGPTTGPVAEFHAVLAPLWHAAPGTARTDATCDAVSALRTKAAAIPGATQLQAEVEALATACAEPARPSFAPRFEAVHTAFHDLAQ
jgi:hypothetical protein